MSGCLFCKIVNKELPAEIVFEDDKLCAFKDINPKAPHHLLIIPKKHLESLKSLKEEDRAIIGEIMLRAKELAKELKIDQKGYRVSVNAGPDSGQAVEHLHFHLLGGKKLGDIG